MEYPAAAAGSGGYRYFYPPQQPQPQPVRRPRRPAARWVKQWCVLALSHADTFFDASAAPGVRLTVRSLRCFFFVAFGSQDPAGSRLLRRKMLALQVGQRYGFYNCEISSLFIIPLLGWHGA